MADAARRIYLDHAATSAPKPIAVVERVTRYLREEGLSAGRGSYRRAEILGREIAAARAALATLLGASAPDRIVFTSGGTESLNLVLLGTLQPGDHVVATDWEHNSVLRPLAWLAKSRNVEVSFVSPDEHGIVVPADVLTACRPETRMICCVHASNVSGVRQPVHEICAAAADRGILTLIDAAQTVGHMPVDVSAMGCDFLAAPAHKGLLAPLGTGFLFVRDGGEQRLQPLLLGGTGTWSESAVQPAEMPGRYESGSLNVPGLLGLAAALDIVTPAYIAAESQRQQGLTDILLRGLQTVPGLAVACPAVSASERVGVVSVSFPGQDPRIVATILDSHFGIEARAGYHCAPRAHAFLGTTDAGGTVRLSVGHTTCEDDIHQAVAALSQITAAGEL